MIGQCEKKIANKWENKGRWGCQESYRGRIRPGKMIMVDNTHVRDHWYAAAYTVGFK